MTNEHSLIFYCSINCPRKLLKSLKNILCFLFSIFCLRSIILCLMPLHNLDEKTVSHCEFNEMQAIEVSFFLIKLCPLTLSEEYLHFLKTYIWYVHLSLSLVKVRVHYTCTVLFPKPVGSWVNTDPSRTKTYKILWLLYSANDFLLVICSISLCCPLSKL